MYCHICGGTCKKTGSARTSGMSRRGLPTIKTIPCTVLCGALLLRIFGRRLSLLYLHKYFQLELSRTQCALLCQIEKRCRRMWSQEILTTAHHHAHMRLRCHAATLTFPMMKLSYELKKFNTTERQHASSNNETRVTGGRPAGGRRQTTSCQSKIRYP